MSSAARRTLEHVLKLDNLNKIPEKLDTIACGVSDLLKTITGKTNSLSSGRGQSGCIVLDVGGTRFTTSRSFLFSLLFPAFLSHQWSWWHSFNLSSISNSKEIYMIGRHFFVLRAPTSVVSSLPMDWGALKYQMRTFHLIHLIGTPNSFLDHLSVLPFFAC